MGRKTIKPFPILHCGQTRVIWNEDKDDGVYVAVQEEEEDPHTARSALDVLS